MNHNLNNTLNYSPEDLLLVHIFGVDVLHELNPISSQNYCIDNKEYLVVSHYIGKKNINKVLTDIAIRKAYMDME